MGPRIYNLFPLLCGTVGDWERFLPAIQAMRFDWVFLNPLHLTGASGSLYSVQDYYRYNPLIVPEGHDGDALLAGFADRCRDAGIRVMLDLVINHTAINSVLVEQHPHWYKRDDAGSIVNAGCVEADGTEVVWEDLAELNYGNADARDELIAYWCDVVRHFVGLGIGGFRCDAAYQVPAEVWQPVITAARQAGGDIIFAAETLGCSPEQVEALRPAGFDYLFNSAKYWTFDEPWLLKQYEQHRTVAPSIAFPESHDTERLVTELEAAGITDRHLIEAAYRRQYLFAAAFSTGVMMPVGFEFGFRKRLHVADTRPGDWEEPLFDLQSFIAEVNRMRESIPALNEEGPQQLIEIAEGGKTAGLLRSTNDGGFWALTLINRDLHAGDKATVNSGVDLALATEITPEATVDEPLSSPVVALQPAQVRIFTGRS